MEFDPLTNEWKEHWTGRQAFSELCPPVDEHQMSFGNTKYARSGALMTFRNGLIPIPGEREEMAHKRCQSFAETVFQDKCAILLGGHLLAGRVDKVFMANLLYNVLHRFGDLTSTRFVSDLSRIGNHALTDIGLSLGIPHCESNLLDDIAIRVERFLHFIDTHPTLQYNSTYGPVLNGQIEMVKCQLLAAIRTNIGGMIKAECEDRNNPVLNMAFEIISSGTKASITHLTQVMGTFGQTILDGERIIPRFKDTTQPHYAPGTRTAASLGYISSNFIQGLNNRELFFQAMDGREGLIATGVNISRHGYVMRRIRVATENIAVMWGRIVTDQVGNVISFVYGDNIDPAWVKPNALPLLELSDAEIEAQCCDSDEFAIMKEYRNILQKYRLNFPGDIINAQVMLPFNLIGHVMSAIQSESKWKLQQRLNNHVRVGTSETSKLLTSRQCHTMVDAWIQGLYDTYSSDTSFSFRHLELEAAVHWYLRPQQLVYQHGFRVSTLHSLLEKLERFYRLRLIEPATAVGVIAAQSVCEPLTQQTISSFHLTGMHAYRSGKVTSMEELINVSEQQSSMTIFLKPAYHGLIEQCKNALVCSALKTVASYHVLEANPESIMDGSAGQARESDGETVLRSDELELLQGYFQMVDQRKWSRCFTHMFRFEIDASKARRLGLSFDDIVRQCQNVFTTKDGHFWVHDASLDSLVDEPESQTQTQTADEEENIVWPLFLVLNLRSNLLKQFMVKTDVHQDIDMATQMMGLFMLSRISIHGVPNILSAHISQVTITRQDEATGKLVQEATPVIFTEGTNLAYVLGLPFVDEKLSYTTNLQEINDVLGIETCRNSISKYMNLAMLAQGAFVAQRHLNILASFMCQRGRIVAMQRHALNAQKDSGWLSKASFEQLTQVLTKGALHHHEDDLRGVTPALMVGNLCPLGTGMIKPLTRCEDIVPLPAVAIANEKLLSQRKPQSLTKAQAMSILHKVQVSEDMVTSNKPRHFIVKRLRDMLSSHYEQFAKRRKTIKQQQQNNQEVIMRETPRKYVDVWDPDQIELQSPIVASSTMLDIARNTNMLATNTSKVQDAGETALTAILHEAYDRKHRETVQKQVSERAKKSAATNRKRKVPGQDQEHQLLQELKDPSITHSRFEAFEQKVKMFEWLQQQEEEGVNTSGENSDLSSSMNSSSSSSGGRPTKRKKIVK